MPTLEVTCMPTILYQANMIQELWDSPQGHEMFLEVVQINFSAPRWCTWTWI